MLPEDLGSHFYVAAGLAATLAVNFTISGCGATGATFYVFATRKESTGSARSKLTNNNRTSLR